MPKKSSTRKSPAKRQSPRKNVAGVDKGQPLEGSLHTEESITKHAELARELVLAAWPGIVQGLIKKAMGGGYQQTKLLLDLCDLTSMDATQLNEERKRQLCDALLEGLSLSSGQPDDQAAKMGSDEELKNTETL